MIKYLSNNKGWAMALVVVMLAVIPIFVVALYTYSMTSTKIVLKQIELERARYMARSGMEAAVYVWQDAELGAKPTGDMERVYLTDGGVFALESTLSAEAKTDSLGYVDVTITFNNDSTSKEYLTTKIVADGIANGTGSRMTATSLPYLDGDLTGWYNDNSGLFNQSNGTITKDITNPFSTTVTYFDLEGVVSCDTKDNDGFTFQDGNTGILVDTIFFNDPVDLTVGTDKLLYITAKKVIFRDKIYLSDGADYETLVLHAAALNAIEVGGSKYGAVYFGGDVVLDGETIISGGSNYYFASGGDGLDLIGWSKLTAEEKAASTDFWMIPSSGDDNAFTPTEVSSIYFIYE